jgi:hypothetical protein
MSDSARMSRFHDAFDRLQGESGVAHLFRAANEMLGTGLKGRLGEKAEATALRPMQLFTSSAIGSDKAITRGVWSMAGRFVMSAMEFYKSHPDELADPNYRIQPKDLGLDKASQASFEAFNSDLYRWKLNFDEMARAAIGRTDKRLFTDQEAIKLHVMAMGEVSSQANVSTMPLGAYNNPIFQAALPLLGWSFRRFMQIAGMRLNNEGRLEMVNFARAMASLAFVATGGLALSMIVQWYYDDLLGKKRNLRPVLGAPNASEAALGLMENMNRVGTFGLFGELANALTNVGTGQDNRALQLDQRVVALSAFRTLMQVASSWIHQGGDADYTHVIRPLIMAIGGNGTLQYMQIANRALGMDNVESRLTARLNAQNYLRVVGRQLGLDVRVSSTGYSAPTALTPHLARMELAAYGNDAADFQAAYLAAVKQAQEDGFEDPTDHIKRAFASRNPLRSVFRTTPSESEYRAILGALDPDGQRDVSQALALFNAYSEQIGARAFEGKKEKAPKLNLTGFRPASQRDARNRALEALYR